MGRRSRRIGRRGGGAEEERSGGGAPVGQVSGGGGERTKQPIAERLRVSDGETDGWGPSRGAREIETKCTEPTGNRGCPWPLSAS